MSSNQNNFDITKNLKKHLTPEEFKQFLGLAPKDAIKLLYAKCLKDPVFFMKAFVKIQHPIKGTIYFNLYEFQQKTLKDFNTFDFNIILKSRQMGISTLVSAYSLWLMLFNKDKNILVISTKQEVAKEIISKVKFANDNLPQWLTMECIEDNRLSLKLKNGSRILATSSASDAGRSFSLSLLIIDECIEGNSYITLRNKKTQEITPVKIGEIYEQEECKNINNWEVLTPTGWSNFKSIKKIQKNCFIKIIFEDGSNLECSENHRIKLLDGNFIYSRNLKKGMLLLGKDNVNKIVKSKRKIRKKIDLYDLIDVEKDKEYYSNDVISHNCAFIENADTIWTSAFPTLSTGGKAIILSTPFGVGGFFHKMWKDAESNKNKFNTITLPWYLHPERDQKWRDQQTENAKSAKEASQELDCSFLTSGATLVDLPIIEYYKENVKKDPVECVGVDRALWTWKYPEPNRNYIVSGDTARGDGSDCSAFHVLDSETLEQCAEYDGQLDTTSFGHLLVSTAMNYNKALLIVENTGLGWAAVQPIVDSDYPNMFYGSPDLKYVDVKRQLVTKFYSNEKNLKAGFTTTSTTRPLILSRLEQYFRDKNIKIYSTRTLGELETFIWHKGKAQAMEGYRDDLVISLAIGLWVRDTALKLQLESREYSKTMLNNIHKTEYTGSVPFYTGKSRSAGYDSWNMKTGRNNEKESLTWLLR